MHGDKVDRLHNFSPCLRHKSLLLRAIMTLAAGGLCIVLARLKLCGHTHVQALSSPVSGVLGDKVDRTHIVALGCFLWGVMTAAIGMSHSLHQVLLLPASCFPWVCLKDHSLASPHVQV